jgi:hypothetical protein
MRDSFASKWLKVKRHPLSGRKVASLTAFMILLSVSAFDDSQYTAQASSLSPSSVSS